MCGVDLRRWVDDEPQPLNNAQLAPAERGRERARVEMPTDGYREEVRRKLCTSRGLVVAYAFLFGGF